MYLPRIKDSDEISKMTEESRELTGKNLYSLAYDHLRFLQGNMDKYDQAGVTIRNWTITLWSATLIAGLIQKAGGHILWMLIGISIAIPVVMGISDQIYRIIRHRYKKLRNELIAKIRGMHCEMDDFKIPDPQSELKLYMHAIQSFFLIGEPRVNIIYWILIIVSILIAFIFRFSSPSDQSNVTPVSINL